MKHVLCVVTVAIFSSVWANAQTIADIARQERAKRQASQKAVVITNETLGIKPLDGTEVKQATEPKTERGGARSTRQPERTSAARRTRLPSRSWNSIQPIATSLPVLTIPMDEVRQRSRLPRRGWRRQTQLSPQHGQRWASLTKSYAVQERPPAGLGDLSRN